MAKPRKQSRAKRRKKGKASPRKKGKAGRRGKAKAKAPRKVTKPANSAQDLEIPNQVFLAVPWKTVRAKYETAVDSLRKRFPLSFVIIGREKTQDAEDLLEVIKGKLLLSSYAIFDATGGNANVSLEFGFSEAHDIPRVLYVSVHKASKRVAKDTPIIADLAGKRRNQYTTEASLLKLLEDFCKQHAYTKRVEQFLGSKFRQKAKGEKKRVRALCLKVIHALHGDGRARRTDVVQRLLADQAEYSREEVDDMIRALHTAGLVQSLQGPYSTVTIT